MNDRKKLTRVTAKKYRASPKREKTKILDIFIGQTGYGRKYAIHILANEDKIKPAGRKLKLRVAHGKKGKRIYPRYYDDAVKEALVPVWEAFNYQCGKLLAPFLHANIDLITKDTKFNFSDEVISKLKKISAATIDRLLRKNKAALKIKGTNGTKPAAGHMKALIPTLSHFECIEQGSGLWQIDLVQHDGGNPSGEFCYTLTVTEVKSSWTVHYALKNKAFQWVYSALDNARSLLPIPVRILHSDNGREFINNAVVAWCKQKGIVQTRSRGSKKNDNCFVEQKNGSSVRKVIGYARFSGDKGVTALQAVYARYDNLFNYFYPCQKLVSKERRGGKVKKTYDKPMSPYERVIIDSETPEVLKLRLRSLRKHINLMAEMRHMQEAIDKLASSADPVPVFVSKGMGLKPLLFGSLSHGSNS
uniref:Integrase domain protein n=1 Tax=uncultured bacterium contig00010 TaxID=1181502 RepID=A0A806KAJ3_9BACT|nr:integrase domain protein [uncultured bacterium contig00010]